MFQEHPDQNKGVKSHEKFVKISEAYNVLSKVRSRKEYDQTLDKHYDYGADSKFGPGFGRPPSGMYERYPGQFHNQTAEDFAHQRRNPFEDDPFFKANPNYFRNSSSGR